MKWKEILVILSPQKSNPKFILESVAKSISTSLDHLGSIRRECFTFGTLVEGLTLEDSMINLVKT